MKKQDITKLNNRSAAELQKEAGEMREKIWQVRREVAGGKIKNVKARLTLRRDLARILTAANSKSQGELSVLPSRAAKKVK